MVIVIGNINLFLMLMNSKDFKGIKGHRICCRLLIVIEMGRFFNSIKECRINFIVICPWIMVIKTLIRTFRQIFEGQQHSDILMVV